MLNDVFIIKRIKEGDIRTFEQVFKMYYSPLCLYALSITGDRDVSEEIIQELFYVLWKDREQLTIFHTLKSYLYGATKNRCLHFREHLEVRERHKEAVLTNRRNHEEENPHDRLEYNELKEVIDRTLHQLPERRLRIFKMHRFEGMKYADIASHLSISVKTVEAEMTKALQSLRKEVEIYTQTR